MYCAVPAGDAYPCFCTDAELEAMKADAEAKKLPPIYRCELRGCYFVNCNNVVTILNMNKHQWDWSSPLHQQMDRQTCAC
jgi:glutamyl/glutaminyl-tRNA synthetase